MRYFICLLFVTFLTSYSCDSGKPVNYRSGERNFCIAITDSGFFFLNGILGLGLSKPIDSVPIDGMRIFRPINNRQAIYYLKYKIILDTVPDSLALPEGEMKSEVLH